MSKRGYAVYAVIGKIEHMDHVRRLNEILEPSYLVSASLHAIHVDVHDGYKVGGDELQREGVSVFVTIYVGVAVSVEQHGADQRLEEGEPRHVRAWELSQ